MFINRVPFLDTISHHIKFGTLTHLTSKKTKAILAGLQKTCSLYNSRGFNVVACRGDHEFESTRDALLDLGVQLNTTARNEHVPEAERYNRTIKDRVRSAYNMPPFKKCHG